MLGPPWQSQLGSCPPFLFTSARCRKAEEATSLCMWSTGTYRLDFASCYRSSMYTLKGPGGTAQYGCVFLLCVVSDMLHLS